MIVMSFDAGESIDAGSMVVMKETGDFKAAVPQNTKIQLMKTRTTDTTKLFDYGEMLKSLESDGVLMKRIKVFGID